VNHRKDKLHDMLFNSKELSDFVNAAREYCNFIEAESSLTGTALLQAIQKHLLELYFVATKLPAINLQFNESLDSCVDGDIIKLHLKLIAERLPFSYYWMVLNPSDMNSLAENGTGDLLDDLGDIYKDLRSAIVQFDSKDVAAKEEAVWSFKFDFDSHWGTHCIEVLSVIHRYLAEKT
jgi:hypothetical protein